MQTEVRRLALSRKSPLSFLWLALVVPVILPPYTAYEDGTDSFPKVGI